MFNGQRKCSGGVSLSQRGNALGLKGYYCRRQLAFELNPYYSRHSTAYSVRQARAFHRYGKIRNVQRTTVPSIRYLQVIHQDFRHPCFYTAYRTAIWCCRSVRRSVVKTCILTALNENQQHSHLPFSQLTTTSQFYPEPSKSF